MSGNRRPDKIFTKEDSQKLLQKIDPIKRKPLIYKSGKDIQKRPIKWLFEDMIPIGEVTVFAGEPGVSKSTLLMKIGALVTIGGIFKAGIFNFKIPQGKVVILSMEDASDSVVVPRFEASGGDLDNLRIIEGEIEKDHFGIEYEDVIRFDRDLGRLALTLEEIKDVKLIIVDPITSYIGDIDDNKNVEVRKMYSKLIGIARKYGCAIILNTHLAKGAVGKGGKAAHKVLGSIAYTAAARAVYFVNFDDDSKTKRKVVPSKNNYGNDRDGFAYTVNTVQDGEIKTTCVALSDEKVRESVDDLFSDEDSKFEKSEIHRAKEFLLRILKNGNVLRDEIMKKAAQEDVSESTLKRAKSQLKINHDSSTINKSKTIWFLSPQSPSEI
jgi:hypothetical protein